MLEMLSTYQVHPTQPPVAEHQVSWTMSSLQNSIFNKHTQHHTYCQPKATTLSSQEQQNLREIWWEVERTGTKFSSKQRLCYHSPFSSRSPPSPIRMTKKTWLEQNTSALDISWEEIPRSFWYGRSLSETPNKKLKRRLKETNLEAKMQVSEGWKLWLPWLFSDP